MTDQVPSPRPRRDGRHWLYTAVAMPLSPLLLGVAVQQDQTWKACIARHGSPVTPTRGSCGTALTWNAVTTLGFWALALASTVTGLVIGIVEGRNRRRLAQGRWVSMAVVGLCAPWALLAYALGYGLGRLLPRPRSRTERLPRPGTWAHAVQQAHLGGWQQALHLYITLANGHQPPAIYAPDVLVADTVYMDIPLSYSRFYTMNVTYRPGGFFAYGSPGLVAGATIGHLIGTSIGHARAARLSGHQWREHHLARVVVTATTTWCVVDGRWLHFDHEAVMQYQLTADQSCVLTFSDTDPLRLHGPSVWCHAVLFAYLRYGADSWQNAPFPIPLREAARHIGRVPR